MNPLTRWLPALSALLLPLVAAGAALPAPVLPQGVGVNIHFTRGHERDLDLIAAAGFRVVRMDFVWSATERRPGQYTWDDYDELTANLERRGLRPYYILDYSNALYEDPIVSRDPVSGMERRDIASPAKPSSIAAFARWAGAAAAHFQGRGIVWEVWNEPNIGFWKPQPKVEDYTALLLATCRAVRAADPEAMIVAPATSEFPWEFLEHLFKAGALANLDGVSVHPYRSYTMSPETARADYLRLRALIERHAPPTKRNLPILSGEWGYATHAKGGVSLDTQAAFLVRQQLSNLAAGVPVSIWYDWKNDGRDPNYHEHNFGTVTADLRPKPAYHAVQTLTRELKGYRIARHLDAPADGHALLLRNDHGDQKIAAWTTTEAGEFTLQAAGLTRAEVAAVDISGKPVVPLVADGQLRLDLGPAPVYLTLKRQLPELTAAAAWRVDPARPTLVTAGQPDAVRVPVTLTNPFATRLVARLRLDGLPGLPPADAELAAAPGQTLTHTFQTTLHQRPDTPVAAAVNAEILLENGDAAFVPLGRSREPLAFIVANPLVLTLAPVAGGIQTRIANPAREPFSGTLQAGHATRPVHLTAGQAEAVVTLATEAGQGAAIRDAAGRLVASAPALHFRPLEFEHLHAALDGDHKVPASATLTRTAEPPAGAPCPQAWRLDYRFAAGWRFLRCEPRDAANGRWEQRPVTGNPVALGMWIHSDGSGNTLRLRLIDASGQTFQPNGPTLDWLGWRWVTIDLSNLRHAGHWGGAHDGVPRGGLRLDCPLLLDGNRRETPGVSPVTGLAWLDEAAGG